MMKPFVLRRHDTLQLTYVSGPHIFVEDMTLTSVPQLRRSSPYFLKQGLPLPSSQWVYDNHIRS